MKMHWFGARDHVDHSVCGGCDDDADCTWNDRPLSSLIVLVIVVATVALVLYAGALKP